jgi:hypothetical protein
MELKRSTKIVLGITLLSVPTVEYGGTFVLRVLTGTLANVDLVGLQSTFFRAGHGHAGVLLLLSLIVQLLSDSSRLAPAARWFVLLGAPVATLLVSGGFFFSVMNATGMPNGLIALIYIGAVVMAVVLIALAVGLFRRPLAHTAS